MPLYEYQCSRCGHKFDVYHQIGGGSGPCPVCGGPARRVFSSVGLIFKGTGFHTTDYRKPSSPATGADGKADGKPAAGPSSSKSPSPPSKTPPKPTP